MLLGEVKIGPVDMLMARSVEVVASVIVTPGVAAAIPTSTVTAAVVDGGAPLAVGAAPTALNAATDD